MEKARPSFLDCGGLWVVNGSGGEGWPSFEFLSFFPGLEWNCWTHLCHFASFKVQDQVTVHKAGFPSKTEWFEPMETSRAIGGPTFVECKKIGQMSAQVGLVGRWISPVSVVFLRFGFKTKRPQPKAVFYRNLIFHCNLFPKRVSVLLGNWGIERTMDIQ